MADDIDHVDEPVEDEEVLLDDDEELDEAAEPSPEDLAAAPVPPEPPAGEVESIQDLLVKQEARAEEEEADEDEEALLATMPRDERLETIESRVVPIQSTEFTCKKCFLVKHRSQLADKKRMLCRDCA
jgi:hypothetical protein